MIDTEYPKNRNTYLATQLNKYTAQTLSTIKEKYSLLHKYLHELQYIVDDDNNDQLLEIAQQLFNEKQINQQTFDMISAVYRDHQCAYWQICQ